MAQIRFGVYLREGGPKIGRGKIQLLKAIQEQGSISAAARSMGMAYRHAWVLLDELNHSFVSPVIVSTMGGSRGGGACLTPWGEELIETFEEMERIANESVAKHIATLESRLARRGPSRNRRTRRAHRTR